MTLDCAAQAQINSIESKPRVTIGRSVCLQYDDVMWLSNALICNNESVLGIQKNTGMPAESESKWESERQQISRDKIKFSTEAN